MAHCETLSSNIDSQASSDFIAELRELYPECEIVETPSLMGFCTLSFQPRSDTDVTLKFRIQTNKSQEISFVSLSSKSLTKKELQPLERSLELQTAISAKGNIIKEAIDIVNNYLVVEGFCDRIKEVSNKKKKKKIKAVKNDDFEENTQNERLFSKENGKRRKNRSREINVSDGSDENEEEDPVFSSLYGSSYQELGHEAVCSSLPLSSRPKHFIAIRVTSKSILDSLTECQKDLVSCEPLLEKGVFAPEIFHLTLLTLGLDSPQDIEKCIRALRGMSTSLEISCPQQPFVIYGMSQFYNRAIFAKVKVEQDFLDFRENLRTSLETCKVEIRDMYEKFNPHLTIIKVKRPERKLFGHRNIQPAIYSHLKDKIFGEQRVEGIHLCSMDGQRREDGFYISLFEINFER